MQILWLHLMRRIYLGKYPCQKDSKKRRTTLNDPTDIKSSQILKKRSDQQATRDPNLQIFLCLRCPDFIRIRVLLYLSSLIWRSTPFLVLFYKSNKQMEYKLLQFFNLCMN